MKNFQIAVSCALILAAVPAAAQLTLNPNPARVVGQPKTLLTSSQPNLVEGRELANPGGLAVDMSSGFPGALYVADTGNNRVLAWKSATGFGNGAPADAVIGQRDRYTTLAQGPSSGFSSGLYAPTAVAVDGQGNLYVADSGNNRIIRFPRPLDQKEDVKLPDMVVGQTSFSGSQPGTSEKLIATNAGNAIYRCGMIFDSNGNLYFSDSANHRVLRFPVGGLNAGANGPSADLVLGQPDFKTNKVPTALPGGDIRFVRDGMAQPSGIALDSAGHLFVADVYNRVLVYAPPFSNGIGAARLMGVTRTPAGQAPSGPTNVTVGSYANNRFNPPEGVFVLDNTPFIIDTPNNRILQFDPVDRWSAETTDRISPTAVLVYGQSDFVLSKPNRGGIESSASSFDEPTAAVVAGNNIYVSDTGNNRVLSFRISAFDTAERVLGQDGFVFSSPNLVEGREFFLFSAFRGVSGVNAIFGDGVGMAVDYKSDPPALFVADTYNNRILAFRDIRKVRPGDKADFVLGQLDFQRVLANSPGGDPDVRGTNGLYIPAALAIDSQGDLWVADSGNSRVLRFPKPFANPGNRAANLVIGQANFTTRITDTTARTLSRPVGLAFTGNGSLLVSDTQQSRVLYFERPPGGDFSNGQAAIKVFGQQDFSGSSFVTGDGSTGMAFPRGIAVDIDDRLFVADTGNNRLLVFDRIPAVSGITAQPAFILTGEATGQTRISSPHAVAISPVGNEVWVADTRNNRVVRFPTFFDLVLGNKAIEAAVPANAPLGLAVDGFGNVLVAEAVNRVSLYFPGVAPANAASGSPRALSPGQYASIYPRGVGFAFGDKTMVFNELPNPLPMPRELADIAVMLDDQPLPLHFVSPGQINFLTPMGNPTSGSGELQVIRPSTGQIIAASTVSFGSASPALFTKGAGGAGQIAALNQDGTENNAANPEGRGRVVQLFGTGQGVIANAPADGTAVPSGPLLMTSELPQVVIGTQRVPDANVLFSGLAPGLVGVWQINVKIPDNVAPSATVPVAVVLRSIASTEGSVAGRPLSTTIAVKQQ